MKRIALAVLTLLAACKAEVKPDAPAPTFDNQELALDEQSLTSFRATLKGMLHCADPCSATRAKLELVVDGQVVSAQEQPLSTALAAGAAGEVSVQQRSQFVKNGDELKAMGARGGSLLVALRGRLYVTQGSRVHEVEFARSKEVRVPRLPHMKFQDFEAGRFSEAEAGMTFHVGVSNPNPFEIHLSQIRYDITIAGKKVLEGVEIGKGERVSPASTGVFDLETKIDAVTHGEAEVKKLIKSKVLPYVVSGEMTAELFSEPFEFKGDIKLNAPK